MGSMDDNIQEYRAVVSNCSELVNSGDYVKLLPPFCEVKISIVQNFVLFICTCNIPVQIWSATDYIQAQVGSYPLPGTRLLGNASST